MELGQRIKAARLEAGLSQRQLCGDRITRNMLSQIENGTARPSMDTLVYIAHQMGRPVGYFLEGEEGSPNGKVMGLARDAWRQRNGALVQKVLEDYNAPDGTHDEEMRLLTYLALLQQAEQALLEGRTPYAVRLLEHAEGCEGLYVTDRTGLALLKARAGLPAELDCDAILLEKAAAEKDPVRCRALLNAMADHSGGRWNLLMGLSCFDQQDYAKAAAYLTLAEELDPRQVVPKLEICYRELGDFRRAYEYACKGRD